MHTEASLVAGCELLCECKGVVGAGVGQVGVQVLNGALQQQQPPQQLKSAKVEPGVYITVQGVVLLIS